MGTLPEQLNITLTDCVSYDYAIEVSGEEMVSISDCMLHQGCSQSLRLLTMMGSC